MALQVPEREDLVLSATGKKVRKGEVYTDRAPEIRFEEIQWGEKIGGGCFGSVYKGKCRGITVAIKKLKKQELDPKMLEDFRKEVDIMTQMRHPNVVLFMGACTELGKLCIVCELLEDSVYNVIHKNTELSLFRRVKMAKDTAAGMAWLHGASPQIIHRDLKPHNLLVDEHWNVKVCDFGLSQVKLENTTLRDGKSIPGTPLWMAPEVMLGQEVTNKADVYAFGLVLWEIITAQEPFLQFDDYGAFKRAITKAHERPVIPKDTHPSLKALMEQCWHPNASNRPSFTEIMPILDAVLVECLVDDSVACKFWKDNFLGKDKVEWDEFASKFAQLLKVPPPNSKDLNFSCLRKLIAETSSDPKATSEEVKLEKFGHFVYWFGPIVTEHKGFTVLDKVRALMQKAWFHGDRSKESTEEVLAGQSKGTFLIRTSTTKTDIPSPFTISKVNKRGKIIHQRIHKRPNGTFEINIKISSSKSKLKISKDDNLVPFIKDISSDLYLENACPGSRYISIFLNTQTIGYVADD